MTKKFSVTYEITTPESAEYGEAESHGFISDACSLKEAMKLCGFPSLACEADCSPIRTPRWFTNYEYDDDYVTGGRESRSLHIPRNVTAASRKRITRLLGLKHV